MSPLKFGAISLIVFFSPLLYASDPPSKSGQTPAITGCDKLTKIFKEINYKKNDLVYRFETEDLAPDHLPTFNYVEVDTDADVVAYKETKRDSRITTDLQSLEAIAKAITTKEAAEPKCAKIPQEYNRDNVEVTLKKYKKDAKGQPLLDKDGNPIIEAEVGTSKLVLGPTEHVWLSADMGINNIKQLTIDQNNNLVEKEKPSAFYIGVNYKAGDVYKTYFGETDNWMKNLSAKFLFRASGTPNDSMGVGLGYEFPWFHAFFARVWSKGDPNASGQIETTPSNVIGISFDISKGLGWLKTGASK